jgi:hypothetical protein
MPTAHRQRLDAANPTVRKIDFAIESGHNYQCPVLQ